MRVAFLLPDLAGGGSERTTLAFAKHWPADEEPPVLVLRTGGGPFSKEAVGLRSVELGLPRTGPAAMAATPRRLAAASEREGIDVVIAPLVVRSVVLAKLFRRDLTVVWLVQNPPGAAATSDGVVPRIRQRTWEATLPAVLKGVDGLVVPTEGFVPAFRDASWTGPVGVIPLPIGIDLPVRERTTRPGRTDGPIRVVSAGRLASQKRFDVLLRAVAVARREADVVLTVHGEGPDRAALESLRRELGLDDVVRLPGFADDPATIYGDADLFALSSDYEGFGHVITEALAFGLPVVATRVPHGPAEILGDGRHGLLVPPRDPEALAAAILSLRPGTDAAEGFAAGARRRAEEYLPTPLAHRLVDHVREVVEAGRGRRGR